MFGFRTEVDVSSKGIHGWANRITLILGITLAALALLAPGAKAGPLVAAAPDCESIAFEQPFLAWADPADYILDRGGAFETGAAGWSLDDAAVVAGNETYAVHGAGDSSSLSIAAGGSATSSTGCVGIEHPTLRFFARNSGSALSTLRTEVLFEDATGAVHALTIGTVANTGDWAPTAQMPLVVNLLPLLPGDYTPVQFRFTPQGGGGEWRIDDVYVDPWRH